MSGDIDLSELQLLPQWAKEPLQQNPYQNYEGEAASPKDRNRHGGRDERGRGAPGRRPPDSRGRDSQRSSQNRGPRPEGGRKTGPDSRSSGPRRDFGGRPHNQNARFQREDRQERPPENLPPLEVLFQPEPHGAESMVKQIKSSGRAYPVFELARMILKKPGRHQVVLQVPPGQTPETSSPVSLFVCKVDQSLWLSEADAVEHVLQKHLGKFYQAEQVAIDPPKGNFNCVGVCGMSGKVLGPPNHHDYPAAARRLHADRFANMSFEDYKSRIRLVKDEAVLTQWKEQQSSKTEYVIKDKSIPAPESHPIETASTVTASLAEVAEPINAEAVAPAEMVPDMEAEPALAAEASSPEPLEPMNTGTPVRFPNLEAVRTHFIGEYQKSEIIAVPSCILGDLHSRQHSDPIIQKIIRRAWDSEVRFPSKTGPALIHSLSKNGLQFFKWSKGITHVAAVRPRRFDPAKSPVAEGVSKILDWVASHPRKTRTDLLQALAPELTPAIPLPAPEPANLGNSVPEVASTDLSQASALPPLPTAGVPTESRPPNASSILSDLHWLLHEGYIVEFANNQLDLLRQNEKPARLAPISSVAPECPPESSLSESEPKTNPVVISSEIEKPEAQG